MKKQIDPAAVSLLALAAIGACAFAWFHPVAALLVAWAIYTVVLWADRRTYRAALEIQEGQIKKLEGEQLILMDERDRYKGAWEATAPRNGEVHITRIMRAITPINEQIAKIIREVGGC